MTSAFTVIQDACCHLLQFQKRAIRIGSCKRDVGCGVDGSVLRHLLELSEELGCGALSGAVGKVED